MTNISGKLTKSALSPFSDLHRHLNQTGWQARIRFEASIRDGQNLVPTATPLSFSKTVNAPRTGTAVFSCEDFLLVFFQSSCVVSRTSVTLLVCDFVHACLVFPMADEQVNSTTMGKVKCIITTFIDVTVIVDKLFGDLCLFMPTNSFLFVFNPIIVARLRQPISIHRCCRYYENFFTCCCSVGFVYFGAHGSDGRFFKRRLDEKNSRIWGIAEQWLLMKALCNGNLFSGELVTHWRKTQSWSWIWENLPNSKLFMAKNN